MKFRIRIVGVIFAIQLLALVGRLFFWQIIKSADLTSQAYAQQIFGQSVDAPRGDIYTSDGNWLAASNGAWLLFATKPHLNEDTENIANKLAPLWVDPRDEDALLLEVIRINELLSNEESVWIPIKHKVTSDLKRQIEDLEINGLGFDSQEQRYYPESSTAAHLLGFVGKDEAGEDRGYFGLEGYYDLTLSGNPGFVERESNAIGAPLLFGRSKEISATSGIDLIAHIDKRIQILVEETLAEGIEKYGAVSGNVVVINPENGGVLAMASYPSYDPKSYFEYGDSLFRNPIISDSFEPGSIFKPLIMASALAGHTLKYKNANIDPSQMEININKGVSKFSIAIII